MRRAAVLEPAATLLRRAWCWWRGRQNRGGRAGQRAFQGIGGGAWPGCRGWGNVGAGGSAGSSASGARSLGNADGRSTVGVPPASRPRRKGRRSASDRSSTRTMCGVSVRTMSDSWASLRLLANRRPINGRSLRPGKPGHHRALFVTDQTGEHVGFTVLEPDRRRDLAIAERRQAVQRARDVAQRHLQRQRHFVVVMRPRRDVDVHADGFVDERGDRLLVDAARGDRGEGRDRDRYALAKPRLRGNPLRCSQLRIGKRPGRRCRT